MKLHHVRESIDNYFEISARGSSLSREILAGLSTYLSLAYIFIVNPAILASAGIDPSAAFFATALASGIATIAMGLWARLPFAVAPGLEMNGFFSFVVVGSLGFTWQQGLGIVFWSGVLCVILTIMPVRQMIIESIPSGLRNGIAVSVGVFVSTIGLYLAKVIQFKNGLPVFDAFSLAALLSPHAIVMFATFATSMLLNNKYFNVPAGSIIAIIIGTVISKLYGISSDSPNLSSSSMFSAVGEATIIFNPRNSHFFILVLVFFVIDFYGGIGKFIGLTVNTNIQKNGKLPNIEKALYVDGFGTMAGSLFGTSSLIAFVESSIGISSGGRTGIVAVVCGALMLASLMFISLISFVPTIATAGVLLYVGWILLPHRKLRHNSESSYWFDCAAATIMAILTFTTFSLDKSLFFGFFAYTLRAATVGRKLQPVLLTTSIAVGLAIAFQYAYA